jgi:hypothetical protein
LSKIRHSKSDYMGKLYEWEEGKYGGSDWYYIDGVCVTEKEFYAEYLYIMDGKVFHPWEIARFLEENPKYFGGATQLKIYRGCQKDLTDKDIQNLLGSVAT